MGGRVQEVFAREGQALKAGDPIVQLDAAELPAQRDLAQAQVDAASRDVESQEAQLQFLRSDAKRQQELLRNRTVSSNEAERASSAATAQAKNVEAAQMRVVQAKANLAQIQTQLNEMKVVSPGDTVLEILSVKVGDVLPPNREVATLTSRRVISGCAFTCRSRGSATSNWATKSAPGSIRSATKNSTGKVEQINRQAEFTPRNVQTVEDRIRQVFGVKIRLENRDDKLARRHVRGRHFPERPEVIARAPLIACPAGAT